jgi:hypothetical protein
MIDRIRRDLMSLGSLKNVAISPDSIPSCSPNDSPGVTVTEELTVPIGAPLGLPESPSNFPRPGWKW